MVSRGIVSADEIRRRIAAAGGDVSEADMRKVPNKAPIDYIPRRRVGHANTREEAVQEYIRYLTEMHGLRNDLCLLTTEEREAHIRAEAEHAVSRQLGPYTSGASTTAHRRSRVGGGAGS